MDDGIDCLVKVVRRLQKATTTVKIRSIEKDVLGAVRPRGKDARARGNTRIAVVCLCRCLAPSCAFLRAGGSRSKL